MDVSNRLDSFKNRINELKYISKGITQNGTLRGKKNKKKKNLRYIGQTESSKSCLES